MILKLQERFKILAVLSSLTGSFKLIEQKAILRKVLEMSPIERAAVDFKQTGKTFQWNPEKDLGIEFDPLTHKDLLNKAVDAFKSKHEDKQDFTDDDYDNIIFIQSLYEQEQAKDEEEKV